jgi:hypothetical protein
MNSSHSSPCISVLIRNLTLPVDLFKTCHPTNSFPMGVEILSPEREADHSHSSSDEVKNWWSYTSPQYILMTWWLLKQWVHLYGMVLS